MVHQRWNWPAKPKNPHALALNFRLSIGTSLSPFPSLGGRASLRIFVPPTPFRCPLSRNCATFRAVFLPFFLSHKIRRFTAEIRTATCPVAIPLKIQNCRFDRRDGRWSVARRVRVDFLPFIFLPLLRGHLPPPNHSMVYIAKLKK